ncbi:class I SAM-dependent methyltransferase [Qipengyuania sp. ASV99]|uniref:class I SAM-dependent methyltransferase n=1 Tax=Qipengyuania sp. ASV99 TaxID=3399681 RepID=UPI003A4C5FEF
MNTTAAIAPSETRAAAIDLPPPSAPCACGNGEPCRFGTNSLVQVSHPEFGAMHVLRCEACGHGVTMPHVPDVSVLYEGRETQDYQGRDNKLATAIKRLAFRRQAGKMLRQTGFKGGNIVDFGCGSGLYTDAIAASCGASDSVTGLDFFADPPAHIGAAQYRPFSQMSQFEKTADLVTCFHVLEHDADPQNVLRQLIALAKPGATVLIEVPHIDCVWRHVFRQYWDNWYLPFHRTHFSRASLDSAIEAAGLSIIGRYSVHTPAIGRSLANLMGKENGLPFVIASALGQPAQVLVERLFNSPSALRIVARVPA